MAAWVRAVAYKRVWGRANIPRGGVSALEKEVTLSLGRMQPAASSLNAEFSKKVAYFPSPSFRRLLQNG